MVVMFLLGWKLNDTRSPKLPMRCPPICADRVGGILHYAQVALPGDRVETVHVHCQPGEVHRHDRPGAWRDCGLELVQIQIAAVQLDVHEHRPRADPHHHVGAGREGHGRHDYLVAGADCARLQCRILPR